VPVLVNVIQLDFFLYHLFVFTKNFNRRRKHDRRGRDRPQIIKIMNKNEIILDAYCLF
jgi:hypothetical protein